MIGSRVLISAQTLASSTGTVTFSSIPSGYKDLVLKCSVRCDASASQTGFYLQINGGTFNVSDTYFQSNGSSNLAAYGSASSAPLLGQVNGATSLASTFSLFECYIANYSVATYHEIGVICGQNTATTSQYLTVASALTDSGAITSVSAYAGGANFVQYSSFHLYGIRNS